LSDREARVRLLKPTEGCFYHEAKILRSKLGRREPSNWAALCVNALAPEVGIEDSVDHRPEITQAPSFRHELKAIHERRDERCRGWLETHAFDPCKQVPLLPLLLLLLLLQLLLLLLLLAVARQDDAAHQRAPH
jgi:hypothetical protein